jgi:hypothetical protein
MHVQSAAVLFPAHGGKYNQPTIHCRTQHFEATTHSYRLTDQTTNTISHTRRMAQTHWRQQLPPPQLTLTVWHTLTRVSVQCLLPFGGLAVCAKPHPAGPHTQTDPSEHACAQVLPLSTHDPHAFCRSRNTRTDPSAEGLQTSAEAVPHSPAPRDNPAPLPQEVASMLACTKTHQSRSTAGGLRQSLPACRIILHLPRKRDHQPPLCPPPCGQQRDPSNAAHRGWVSHIQCKPLWRRP